MAIIRQRLSFGAKSLLIVHLFLTRTISCRIQTYNEDSFLREFSSISCYQGTAIVTMSLKSISLTEKKQGLSSLEPEINIFLGSGSNVTYKTNDQVEGVVSIKVWKPTPFTEICVQFQGRTTTLIQTNTPSATPGRSMTSHIFLKQEQPIDLEVLSCSQILGAGQTYSFDFEFHIPQQLLPHACTHHVSNEAVRQSHLQLPPSIGIERDGKHRNGSYHDLSPAMLFISYEVIACVYNSDGPILRASKSVRVVPMSGMEPPVYIEDNKDFQPVEERIVRRGVFRKKSGVLSAQAMPPEPVQYQEVSQQDEKRASKAAIILQFNPLEKGAKPPRIGCLTTRLLVANFFASRAQETFPSVNATALDAEQGTYIARIKLDPMTNDKSVWRRVPYVALPSPDASSTNSRHDSFASAFSISFKNGVELKDLSSYQLRLEVPIVFPTNHVLVPTFHTCLGSRTYTLQILIEIPGSSAMELRVPFQVYNE